jgi:uncharacterized protein (TIGR03437 family)
VSRAVSFAYSMKPNIFRKRSLKSTIFVCLTGAGSLLLPMPGRAQSFPQYTISTVVGTQSTTGGYSGDGGAPLAAQLSNPSGVAYAAGNLYIADQTNNRIRYVTNGVIQTVAGDGTATANLKGLGDTGQATSGELTSPFGLTVDGTGDIYIADTDDDVIQYVTAAGKVTTFAGNYSDAGYGGDNGLATGGFINRPASVALDSKGNLYIADTANNVIRKVTASTGNITTVAGNNQYGYLGDGGPATSAELYNPEGVALDAAGNIYIADSFNNVIRKVTVATGIITTIAGIFQVSGVGGFAGDGGLATQALLSNPEAVAVDSSGNLYIADTYNNRIRVVTANGFISTIAGNGSAYYGGDGGPATSAQLFGPSGLALDGSGNIYVADTQNNVIRLLTFVGLSTPAPAPVLQSVENAANYQVNSSAYGVAPNSFISVYASNLGTASGSNLFPNTSFQGIEVLFNGTPAPLYYVNGAPAGLSNGLINLGVPSNLGTSGTAAVTVQTYAGTSANYTLNLAPFDVGIFRLSADPAHPNNGAITIANSQWLVMPASTAAVYGLRACTGLSPATLCGQPAHVGNSIVIYFTGGGLATPNGSPSGQPLASGSVAPVSGNPLYETVQTPVVTIGGVTVPASQVTFSGIAPGTAWEYQINTTIPAGVATGDSVPVVVTFGSSSDTVTISVQ